MTEGLVTRIGRWIDRKWQEKATEEQVENLQGEIRERWSSLENAQIKDKIELKALIANAVASHGSEKDLADLKTRIEKIELYCGMTRKVDPTKPPVAKSAFAM